jgi:hypothetical protein
VWKAASAASGISGYRRRIRFVGAGTGLNISESDILAAIVSAANARDIPTAFYPKS